MTLQKPVTPRIQGDTVIERKIIADIAETGWSAICIFGEPGHPPFAYTIGLFESYGHPELLIYGLPFQAAHGIFSLVQQAAAKFQPFDLGVATNDLIQGYSCVFVEIPQEHYMESVRLALWYYQGNDFPLFQVVWPSQHGLFPWHPDAPDSFRAAQPILGQSRRAS